MRFGPESVHSICHEQYADSAREVWGASGCLAAKHIRYGSWASLG